MACAVFAPAALAASGDSFLAGEMFKNLARVNRISRAGQGDRGRRDTAGVIRARDSWLNCRTAAP
jgi:hypothetical protein